MNKLLLVVLAICLVNVHAFVKRDTATPEPFSIEKMQNELSTLSESIKKELEKTFNPDTVKDKFNGMVDDINKFISNLNTKDEPSKQ